MTEKIKIGKKELEVPEEQIALITALMELGKQIKGLGDKL